MLVFKFQRPSDLAFTSLRRGEIFFALQSELNDAHECRPRFILSGNRELWQRLSHYLLVALCIDSGYHKHAGDGNVRKVIEWAAPIGTQIKKRLRNKDLPLNQLDEVFLEVLRPFLPQIFLNKEVSVAENWMRNFIQKELPRKLEANHYISCFALNGTNPTMWGHYADAEKGFVIVYQTNDRRLKVHSQIPMLRGSRPRKDGFTEIGIYDEEQLELKPVVYRKLLPKLNAFHPLIPMFTYSEEEDHYDVPANLYGDAAQKEENQLGLVKSSDWRYEREARVFLPYFDSGRSRFSEGPLCPDLRSLRVSMDNLVGLIFGAKMSDTNKQRAISCCYLMRQLERKNPPQDFFFFQARQGGERINLSVIPLGNLEDRYFASSRPIIPFKELAPDKAETMKALADSINHPSKNPWPEHVAA